MNNELIIHGTITKLLPMESGFGKTSGKPWSKQTCVLLTDERYPKTIAFEVWGDKVNDFAIKPGERLSVYIDVESREFNGRWYTEVKGYKIERIGMAGATPTQASYQGVRHASQVGASPAPAQTMPPQGQQPPLGNYQTMPQQGATMQAPPNDLPF